MVVGPHHTGKTALLSLLQKSHHLTLTPLCPNAYSTTHLYGTNSLNGIIFSLLENILHQLKHQQSGMRRGLLLEGELAEWAEPLAGAWASGHIIQPNGNTLLMQEDIKLVFECRSLGQAPPTLCLGAAVVSTRQEIQWQSIFTWHIHTQMQADYRHP